MITVSNFISELTKKQNIGILAAILIFSLATNSCSVEDIAPNFISPNKPIVDIYGRTLILHGWNTSSSAKGHPERQPWIIESDVEREAKEFGNNFVRYLIFWDGVEPEQGIYNDEYLDKVEERVNWYTSRGMYVLLDMHQDLYSIVFGGDGAPEWALETDGNPIDVAIDGPWWLSNLNPAVIACWKNFWEYSQHKYLQDHYIAMWQKVVERFKDNPYVLGYDLMNEPWGGDLINAFITGDFERRQLTAFYERLIPAIRAIDNDAYIFFEPAPAPVTFGAQSHLGAISDTRSDSRIVYAPHCYPLDVHEGTGYTSASKLQLKNWEEKRQNDVEKHGKIPLMCGEFGGYHDQRDFESFLIDVLNMFDKNTWSWTWWSSDLGSWGPLDVNRDETLVIPYLVRTYPKATSGMLQTFNFNQDSKEFTMYFVNMNTGQPSEIFVPKRHYPNGYDIIVEGSEQWTSSYNDETQVLSLNINEAGVQVKVTVIPI